MTTANSPRKYAVNTRGKPFAPGNPGKPKGARNRTTLTAEALLEGEGDALTRKAIELALAGDVSALRLCLERLIAPRRERHIAFELPPIVTASDLVAATAALARAVACGELTPGEAASLSQLLTSVAKAIEVAEFDQRLRNLEEKR